MSTLARVEAPADAELISAVRGGDVDAYGELFARHVDAARRLARQLVSAGDADDLVSEAFAKVLGVLQRGGGPDVAFRAYLLTAVRRLHVDRVRATARLHTTDDLTPFDPGVPFEDTAVAGFENAAAARAFSSLPERWQLVLWHMEVEGQKPAEIAPLLGMSANSVSALAYRAREGLRQAFLNQHAQELEADECRWTHDHLGAYIRGGTSRRDGGKVEHHLQECRRCMAIYLELTEVNSNLAGIIAPLLLGGSAAAYLATAGGVAGKGGLLLLLERGVERTRETVGQNAAATVAVGAVAATVAAALVAGAVLDRGPDPVADGPPPAASSPAAGGDPAEPDGTGDPDGSGPTPRIVPAPERPFAPVPRPVAPVLAPPTDSPSDAPAVLAPSPSVTLTTAPTFALPPVPAPSPTLPLDGGPSESPTPTSTATTTTSPAASVTPTPSESTDQPAELTVEAELLDSTGANHQVRVVVSGLSAGVEGTVTVSSDDDLTFSPPCPPGADPTTECTVTSENSTLTFEVNAGARGGTMHVEVTDGESTDTDEIVLPGPAEGSNANAASAGPRG